MRVSDLILRSIAKRCVSKDDATELESALKRNTGSPSFTPDHPALFLCARPDQLEPVRQDGPEGNFQTCAPGGVVDDGAIDNRVARTANDLGDLGAV